MENSPVDSLKDNIDGAHVSGSKLSSSLGRKRDLILKNDQITSEKSQQQQVLATLSYYL
jgi:hypothetical protein